MSTKIVILEEETCDGMGRSGDFTYVKGTEEEVNALLDEHKKVVNSRGGLFYGPRVRSGEVLSLVEFVKKYLR